MCATEKGHPNFLRFVGMKTTITAFFLLIVLASCNFGSNQSGSGEMITEGVRGFEEDNPILLESIKRTRDSLPYFISRFKSNTDDLTWFSGKFEVHEGSLEEHIWLEILEIDGENSVGVIINEPYSFQKIKYLDTINFDISKAEDIMILKDGSILFGNFLERLLTKDKE